MDRAGNRKDTRDSKDKSERLREIAQEASARLDSVLPGGEGAGARQGGRTEGGAAPVREHSPGKAARDGGKTKKALVSHISPGVARILANLLKHQGLSVSVASSPGDFDGEAATLDWDIVFMQGTATPYPSMALVRATLEHCEGLEAPFVLVKRRGEETISVAEEVTVSGFLEWPLRPEDLRKGVADVLGRAR